ncbi:MAG: GTP 3',8-cyclase MoaA [Dehalococcoidales bacterium]|jgi:cyclic pyranopterin phosphate synthase|nr:GTP 3',8-cyclase MoaA [Dehalococcoidales bacterium]
MTYLIDNFRRRINYMRISVTDHCNLRCIYCTAHLVSRLKHEDILRYEEIERITRVAVSLGIDSLRLTGGEPLMRPYLERLVNMLSNIEGIKDISMTTNAITLAKHAKELADAGLNRVNISLDSLKEDKFKYMTGYGNLSDVYKGIEAAAKAGLSPIKINTVMLAGVNDNEILDFAAKTRDEGWHVRFIEYMPFASEGCGADRFAANQTVSGDFIKDTIISNMGELTPVMSSKGNGPAKYYHLAHAEGTIGFIGAVTGCFCEACNRMRLTADGKLRPCLLDDDEIDIKTPLRQGITDEGIKELMSQAVAIKHEKHRLGEEILPSSRQMWQIGG